MPFVVLNHAICSFLSAKFMPFVV